MKISIKDLKNGSLSRIIIDSKISLNKDELGHEIIIDPEFAVKGFIYNHKDNYILDFNYNSKISYLCERCLEKSVYELSSSAHYDLSEEEFDEFGSIMIDNRTVNLSKALFDDVYIHLPTQMFCEDECHGICIHCGVNLNNYECLCSDEEIDPRLQKLKILLKNEEV